MAQENNNRLRAAVHSVEVPPFLEARIRNLIRAEQRRIWPRISLKAVAATLGVLLIAWQLNSVRTAVVNQESDLSSVFAGTAPLIQVGLGDHIRCAVFRKYPKNPPTADELIREMGPRYAGLIPVFRSHVPPAYRMTLAHECQFNGRRFVHLSLRSDSNMLSLVIAHKAAGETFRASALLPALVQSGIPMYESSAGRFCITAFESRDDLVYLISDLPAQTNTQTMLALAPQVNEFLAGREL